LDKISTGLLSDHRADDQPFPLGDDVRTGDVVRCIEAFILELEDIEAGFFNNDPFGNPVPEDNGNVKIKDLTLWSLKNDTQRSV
jgi:hypothetical protein